MCEILCLQFSQGVIAECVAQMTRFQQVLQFIDRCSKTGKWAAREAVNVATYQALGGTPVLPLVDGGA